MERLLQDSHSIAIVGISDKPDRPSYNVAAYLLDHGYKIIPVNPNIKNVLGQECFPDLLSVPGHIDIVDIFRKSEDVGPVVEQAIMKKANAIWMQLGIVNEAAANLAEQAGLDVVMDRCLKIEHGRIYG
jgi:hypothetical protein